MACLIISVPGLSLPPTVILNGSRLVVVMSIPDGDIQFPMPACLELDLQSNSGRTPLVSVIIKLLFSRISTLGVLMPIPEILE